MRVGYQHVNPHGGRESTFVRFHDELHDQTTCVLVDAGASVDVGECLGDDEYLSAILLTHAHIDHYRTLGSNLRDGAPVYATSETVAALTARLDSGGDHVDQERGDEIRAALEPISGWTDLTSDVRIHPVPAGHAPGACGFVLQFADGDDRHHLLASGDFTTRRAGGYPGLSTDLPVDAVFLTAATAEDFQARLTDALARVLQRSMAGSTVLATASGSTGVHLAHLLAHVGERTGSSVPVTVVGRAATLWNDFGYEHPAVESVPRFDDPWAVIAPGRVTIAGPEVPVAGSSERLFGAIEDDDGATLVQLTSGAFDPKQSASCTVDHYELRNHPTEATVDSVVEELEPIHVVVTHQQGTAADRYKDKYDAFVWATDDRSRYTLYEDGAWTGPPWVTEATRRRVRSRHYRTDGQPVGATVDASDVPLPAVERRDDVDLDAEGVDVDRLAVDLGLDADQLRTPPVEEPDEAVDEGVTAASGSRSEAATDSEPPSHRPGATGAAESTAQDSGAELREIRDRLDRIEAEVTGARVDATVVDAGEDLTLLRLTDESLAAGFTHGQSVRLTVHDVDDPAVSSATPLDGDGSSRSDGCE